VDQFAETISTQAKTAAPEGEQQITIQATGESFVAQTRKLTDYVRELAGRISPTQRHELDQFLRVQDGEALATRAMRASEKVISPGGGQVTMGFFDFLQEHMHALKKILRGIIQILFDLFDAPIPKWIDSLLLIIDEILDLLLSLVGGIFGHRISQVADDLSRREVNFLGELAALAALHAIRTARRPADDEA
jgi:hypothetical protein